MKLYLKQFVEFNLEILCILVLLILTTEASGQTPSKQLINELLPPSKETFKAADGLIVPWRDTGCNIIALKFREPECYEVSAKEWLAHSILSIYNADGSNWYTLNVQISAEDHFSVNPKQGFIPFSVYPTVRYASDGVLLRLVKESKNWYEVEINEQTRETKFILKDNSKQWGKSTFDYWLYEGRFVEINPDKRAQQFFEEPNGKKLEDFEIPLKYGKILKVENEWVKVEITEDFSVWLRWKKGRDILVGCVFNEHKYPEIIEK